MQSAAKQAYESEGFRANDYLSRTGKDLWKYAPSNKLTSVLAEEGVSWRVARTKTSIRTITIGSTPKQLAFDFGQQSEGAVRNQPSILVGLEDAADKGDESAFLRRIQDVNWQELTAPEFVRAIKSAFRAGAFTAARQIAHEGAKLYPSSPDVQKYANLLNPVTRVAGMPSGKRNNAGANRAWLKEHAGKYRGQWLALRDGELLGVSPSLDTLTEEVSSKYGITFPSKEVMITAGY